MALNTELLQSLLRRYSTSQHGPKKVKPKKSEGLFRRLTNKLKPSASLTVARAGSSSHTSISGSRSISGGRLPKATPPLPNDIASKERREAALRERGLLPSPPKDLSYLERDYDRRYTKVVPIQDSTQDGESAAQKIRQEWETKHNDALNDGSQPQPSYPETLSRPDLSRSRLTVGDNGDKENEQRDQPPHSTEPRATPASSADSAGGVLSGASLKAKRPPIIITTTSPRESLVKPSNAHDLQVTESDRALSNPICSLTTHPSISTKASLPGLSPTQTSSSFSSLHTPRDDGTDNVLPRSYSRSSSNRHHPNGGSNGLQFLGVEQEKIVDPSNGEYAVELGGFEQYVERRKKRGSRRSNGVFSGNSSSDHSSGGSAYTSSVSSHGSQSSQSKKFASFRLTMSKLGHSRNPDPPLPTMPIRTPTLAPTLQSRENILNQINGIEDEESRRLSEMAFMDF